jgi:serine/threonine protein kinase
LRRLCLDRTLDDRALEQLFEEVRTAGMLRHAHVVQTLDYGLLDGRPFVVQELVDGDDLAAILKRSGSAMPESLALHVATRLLSALSHAHDGARTCILHRRIRLESVLFSFDGDVKLADFGIASALKSIGGDPDEDLAPEQGRGEPLDVRADIFAVGSALRRMLGASDPDAAQDISAIIRRARRSEKADRYGTAEEMAHDCEQALSVRARQDARRALSTWLKAHDARTAEEVPAAALRLSMRRDGSILGAPCYRFTNLQREGTVDATRIEDTRIDEPKTDEITRYASDPLIGAVLNGYRITSEIGRGVAGRVFAAEHTELGRQCAIKVMNAPLSGDSTSIERVRREIQALHSIHHPNVVRLMDFGTTPAGAPFLAMERLPGPTFRDLLNQEGLLTPSRAAHYMKQIASGLQAAHRRGLVHRDLKPPNVMLGVEPDELKIVDFSLVRMSEQWAQAPLTRAHQYLGTPAYAAPEQILDPRCVGPSADLYALGVMAFEMLEGRVPFSAPDLTEVLRMQLTVEAPPLRPAAGLERVVRRLLAKDPIHRPASAEALIAELDALGLDRLDDTLDEKTDLRPEPGTTPRPKPVRSARVIVRRAPRTSRTLFAVGLVLIMTAAAITTMVIIQQRPTRHPQRLEWRAPSASTVEPDRPQP